ncbi:amidase family protein [Jiangella anatolica]|nr:amidase family protein [Jiangella anatolica]
MPEAPEAASSRPLEPPSTDQLAAYAVRQGSHVRPDDLERARSQVADYLRVFERLERLADPHVPVRHHHRDPGRPPLPAEDPYHAVVRFCEVRGSASGPLAGMRVGVKDNVAVAGVPMTGGRPHARAVVPTEDAVAVERLLDAGAVIVAKTNMSGSVFEETRNPLDRRYSAGVSSSGSAAAVASGFADAALGVDQAGSVRWPAAWCGLVGMKATHGLVPSYGLLSQDHTIDHIGPITRSVAENAALLETLAGQDWRDPYPMAAPPVEADYTSALDGPIKGLRIAVIGESLEPSGCTEDTLREFGNAQKVLIGLGADVVRVSVPLWTDSFAIWLAGAILAQTAMIDSLGQGYGHFGRVDVSRVATMAGEQLIGDHGATTMFLTREHVRSRYLGVPFGRAQNLRLELRRQVEAALGDADLLITPTSPTGPAEVPSSSFDLVDLATKPPEERSEAFIRAAPILTCCPFNLTGHPALTVPSGVGDDGMPRGLQIIGPQFGEHLIYRAGHALESATA